MIYPINKIYTEVKSSVASLCKNTSRTFKSTTKTLPFLYFKVLGNPSTFNDLDNNENAIILTIEIHVYTSGTNAMSQAEKIFKLANDDFGGNIELVWNLVEEEILNNLLQKEYIRIYG